MNFRRSLLLTWVVAACVSTTRACSKSDESSNRALARAASIRPRAPSTSPSACLHAASAHCASGSE